MLEPELDDKLIDEIIDMCKKSGQLLDRWEALEIARELTYRKQCLNLN